MFLNLINNNEKIKYLLTCNFRLQTLKSFKSDVNKLNILSIEILYEIIKDLSFEDIINFCDSDPRYNYICNDAYFMKRKVNNLIINPVDSSIIKDDRTTALKVILKFRDDDKLNRGWLTSLLIRASRKGYLNVTKILLAEPRLLTPTSDLTGEHHLYLYKVIINHSISENKTEEFKLLISDARAKNIIIHPEFILNIAVNPNSEFLRILLTQPNVDFGIKGKQAVINANVFGRRSNPDDSVILGLTENVKLLLADERVNPGNLSYEEFFRQ